MKRLTALCLFLLCLGLVSGARGGETPEMGVNFDGLADWSTELPFVNVFWESREWISQREGESWGKGPALELDEHGWVRRLEKNCWAETPLCTIDGGHYPSGIYTVRYRGKGKISFMNAEILEEKSGEMKIRVNSEHGAFWLQIRETDPEDYVRGIRILMPGLEKKEKRVYGPWNPEFIKRWKGLVKTVRFMDMQKTNGSRLEKWSERPVFQDASFTKNGAPIELLCDLANRLEANAWFCVPHRADDEFVREMARTIRKHLNPNLKVYVEYSNEVWNGQFEQCRYAQEMGKALLPNEEPWVRGWAWTSKRSREIFEIFGDVFDGRDQLVRVLATQAANSYVSEQLLKFSNAAEVTDVLAIAPYVMNCVPKEYADEFIKAGTEAALDDLRKNRLPQSIEWMKKQKELADQYGLSLACYEGGQHLVGLWGANEREELNQICLEANRSPKMGEIYDEYFKAWEEIGGGVLCHFSSTGHWSKWGSWGLLQYADEDVEKSPKFQAFQRAAKRWNQEK